MVVEKVRKSIEGLKNREWRMRSGHLVIRDQIKSFGKIFQDNFVTLIISAFGVVAALSWNEAIKEVVAGLFPTSGPLFSKVYSAIAITIISIFATYLLSKLKSK